MTNDRLNRRRFLGLSAALFGVAIVPRRVLGGQGYKAPSETITRGVVGTGGQGMGGHVTGPPFTLAVCDVDKNHLAAALKKAGPQAKGYTDFRRVLEHKDIDTVHIATPPHWHALVSIAACDAGKDVLCEKPMHRFIHEGLKVIEAVKRNGRVFQIGTYGRFDDNSRRFRKLVASGLLGTPLTVRVGPAQGYNWKVKMWSGMTVQAPQPVPAELDYEMWLGPAPYKPYHPHRVHGSFRGYWDYDGGGLADMGQHYLDPVQYWLGKDSTSPAEVWADAPWPAHPDACGPWGTITFKYADGTTLILSSGEWGTADPGPFLEGPRGKVFPGGRTDPPGLFDQIAALPNPPGLMDFNRAVVTRQQPGGNADVVHRSCCLMHLANIAIRTGRRLKFDPESFRFVGDEEANRFVNLPVRAPWHL